MGLPIARACAVLSLATRRVCDLAIGPYEGKETGENALLRAMLDTFEEDDVVVFDRYFCSFMMLALLSQARSARVHPAAPAPHSDFRRGSGWARTITWSPGRVPRSRRSGCPRNSMTRFPRR